MEKIPLRIASIQVRGLFGLYDHFVRLNLVERITIIHGPNGVGKTALLRLIDAFVNGQYLQIMKVSFEAFELTLSDHSSIGIRKINPDAPDSGLSEAGATDVGSDETTTTTARLEFFRTAPGVDEVSQSTRVNLQTQHLARAIGSNLPWINQLGKDLWLDRRTGERYTTVEIGTIYGSQLPRKFRNALISEPEWVTATRNEIRVHLIETQRLLRISTKPPSDWTPSEQLESTVKNYAEQLHTKIAEILAEYGKASQSLDQSFPQRLLSEQMKLFGVSDLKERMEALENKRKQLKRIGLLEEEPGYPFDIAALDRLNESQRAVMTLYVDDTGHKLGVLDDLARRITLLLDNVNRKFRFKSLSIDKKKGLVALDKNGRALDLDALSSGEQHELVLIYDLLFRVKPNTLVMIDEPELSLHISWQKSFLSDLMPIVQVANFDILLATHSPFVAGDRSDLMIPLASEST